MYANYNPFAGLVLLRLCPACCWALGLLTAFLPFDMAFLFSSGGKDPEFAFWGFGFLPAALDE